VYRSTIYFQQKKVNQIKGIKKKSNGEMYAVQQTTNKARIKDKNLICFFFLFVKYGQKKNIYIYSYRFTVLHIEENEKEKNRHFHLFFK
jgi:hypothetical protein